MYLPYGTYGTAVPTVPTVLRKKSFFFGRAVGDARYYELILVTWPSDLSQGGPMAVSQAKTCRWAAYYLGALYAARAEQCNISDKLVLAAARVPSGGGTHNLFAVERANALACAASATGRLAAIERTMAAPPSRNGVVFVKIFGGFGNELNLMTHAALVAVALNRTVCADAKGSWTFQFLNSPALRHAITWREGCANLTRRQVRFDTLDTAPRDRTIAVAIGRMNHCPTSRESPASRSLAVFYGAAFTEVVACLSHALFRPGARIRASAAPYLRIIRGADVSLGVHIRTTDATMARHQGYNGSRNLALDWGRFQPA